MKRFILAAALCLAAPLALAGDKAGAKADADKSCGQKLSENAKYPRQLNAVLTSAADFYQAHAQWVGTGDAAAKAEHDKLMQLVKEHRALADEARKVSDSLQASASLPAAEHARPPTPEVRQSMEKLQREMHTFAQLLERGVRENRQALQAMRRAEQGTPKQGTGGSGTGGSGLEPPASDEASSDAPAPEEAPEPTQDDAKRPPEGE
jgi:hypothetical protein